MICPNCGRNNPRDAAFCVRCGQQLPQTGPAAAGISYKRAQPAEPTGGGGQGLLAFGAFLLAGLLFAGGALALFLANPPGPAPTRVAVDPTSTLPIFVQPTATVAPTSAPTPVPSFSLVPTIDPSALPSTGLPSPSAVPVTPPPPTATPRATPRVTPTPDATPTRTPRPSATPTPEPTAVSCAEASGEMRTIFFGPGNVESRGPLPRAWCIQRVIIRPNDARGTIRLVRDGREIHGANCNLSNCNPEDARTFDPPRRIREGSTIGYEFVCLDDPSVECGAGIPFSIEVNYFAVTT